ncbi:MAG: hypothetical protein ABI772_04340 [Bacteroidota bacterium]
MYIKNIVLLLFILFTLPNVSMCQVKSTSSGDVTFCGKPGESGPTGGNYTIQELTDCDFTITPLDTNFKIAEFQLSIYGKDALFVPIEIKIKGNKIPDEYRAKILKEAKNVFLEYIKATASDGTIRLMKPVGVRIQ